MAEAEQKAGRNVGLRVAAWAAAIAAVLAVPFTAMQFSGEVNWTAFDFILVAVLLGAIGAAYELAAARGSLTYRAGVAVAVAAGVMLFVVSGAVGVIGSEDDPANMLYVGLIVLTALGAALSGFRAGRLAMILYAAAGAQVLIATVALVAGWGQDTHIYPWDIVGATGFFTVMWVLAAGLFGRAARG